MCLERFTNGIDSDFVTIDVKFYNKDTKLSIQMHGNYE